MTYEPVTPVMQVAAIETNIGDFNNQRTIRIRISLHAGPSVAKFEDLPPDAREVLAAWVLGEGRALERARWAAWDGEPRNLCKSCWLPMPRRDTR